MPLSHPAVRERLAGLGYDNVTSLRPGRRGRWTGTATLSGKQRLVTVARDGAIAAH